MVVAGEEPRVFKIGEVFRSYLIEEFLGEGASGQVYGVRHLFTGERLAFKATHMEDRAIVKKVERSLVEAQTTYRLQHQNIVRVFDLALEENGMVWLAMERLDGRSVADLLALHGNFSPLYAIDVAVDIAFALQAAHEQGVVHRDVQPSNVFVTARGVVKVLDFSLCKVEGVNLQTTKGQHTMGTAGYMAPEHVKEATPTPLFDVYALGVLFWQMLAGRHPFAEEKGNVFRLIIRHLEGDLPSIAEATGLPAYCDEVIRRATAKDPQQRYQGMWPFVQALHALADRLLADPAAALLVRHPPVWERYHPIAQNPGSWQQHTGPRSLPFPTPEAHLPSARVVVTAARGDSEQSAGPLPRPAAQGGTVPLPQVLLPAPAMLPAASPPPQPRVAPTVPMPVMAAPPAAPARAPRAGAGPTLRTSARRPRSRALLVLAPLAVLAAAGAVVWILFAWNAFAAPVVPTPARPRSATGAPLSPR